MRCRLPGGLVDDDGAVHTDVELRALSGREEELLAGADGAHCAATVSEILGRCVLRLGSLHPVDATLARRLLVADRQYLLLKLREATFGPLVRGSAPCPWPDCGHRVAVTFRTGDVPVVAAASPGPVHTTTLSPQAAPDADARSVEFRLPVGADQEALSPVLLAHGEADALTGLLRTCVLRIGDAPVDDDLVAGLSPLARREIEEAMEQVAPRIELVMDATCVECGRAFEAPFDLQGFFFGEVTMTADALRREVHYLAFHYHWSEREILELDRGRRRGYIEVLADEIERLNERA